MKFEWNKKYTTISVYVLIVATIGMILFQAIANFAGLCEAIGDFIDIISPFLLGLTFAYIFYPIVKFFETKILPPITGKKLSRRVYRFVSIILTVLVVLSCIVFFFYFIIPNLSDNIEQLIMQFKGYAPEIKNTIAKFLTLFHMEEFTAPVISTLSTAVEGLLGSAIGATIDVTNAIIDTIIGIFITIYLWISKEKFLAQSKKLSYALFPKSFVEKAIALLQEANRVFGGFITGKIIDSVIIGILCYIGMLILDIPHALLISVIVGVTNFIPYVGPFIGAIPSVLLLLIVDPVEAIWFAVFVLILQQIDGNIIGPKILGDSTGLSAIWVVFAVIVFGGVFGFTGMLIGVPLFAIIYTLISRAVNERLLKKNMSIDIDDYASEENPIIKKKERKVKKEATKK